MLVLRSQANAGPSRPTVPQSWYSSGDQILKVSQHVNPRTASRVGQHLLVCKDRLTAGDAASSAGATDFSGNSSYSVNCAERLPHLAPTSAQQLSTLGSGPLAALASSAPSVLLEPDAVVVQDMTSSTAVFDVDAWNPHYNKSGLNGLNIGSTSGLSTGHFTVSSQMPVHYTVQQVHGLLDISNKTLLRGVVPGSFPFTLGPEPTHTGGMRRLVVIDENVHQLYHEQIDKYFQHHGVEVRLLPLPTREENKEFDLVFRIAEALEDFKLNRRQEPIIAIGGGVCLDAAGLAANLYRRNTGIIKVPTTVMGVVDASIGIKTAVNFHEKKNKLGTYCPPLGVFYDTSFLQTLEQRHISNGAAEILKMACIKDDELFSLLERHAEDLISNKFQGKVGSQAFRRSIQGMLEELEYNLWEAILVRLVDYGHTISPELEMAALRGCDMLLHGEAVNIDMALSTEIAAGRGLLTAEERHRVLQLMLKLRLPLWHSKCSVQLFMKGLADMTRARDGLQRVPLMKGLGAASFVNDITEEEIAAAVSRLVAFAAAHGDAAAMAALPSLQHTLDPQAGAAVAKLENNVVPVPSGVATWTAVAQHMDQPWAVNGQ